MKMTIRNLTPHVLTVLVEDPSGPDEVVVGRGPGALTVAAAAAAGREVHDLLMPGVLATLDGKPFGILSFARQG